MKHIKMLFVMALMLTICSIFSSERGYSKTAYVFGIAASFMDIVVYFMDIQMLDSAKVSRGGFLTHHDLHSCQLRNYVEDNGLQQNSTCTICFSEGRKKLERGATKILSKYKGNRNTTATRIDTDKFHFIKPEE